MKKKQLNSICSEFAQHKKIIGKKMPIFAQEYKIANTSVPLKSGRVIN